MRILFTSDLHLGHDNIIGYCSRPMSSVDEMNSELIRRWNDTVTDDDMVWVLGDFALGTLDATLPLTRELRGHKILLAGNHDRCWRGRGERAEGWTERYLDAGFDEVRQGEQSISIGKQDIRLCHFPYEGDSQDHDRYVGHRPVDRGGWLLHGHVHERWRQRGRMINVGVDANDFRPVGLDEIARLIAAGAVADLPAVRSEVAASKAPIHVAAGAPA